MITLVIDASTYRGTVAVFRGDTLLASGSATMRGAHAEALMPAVAQCLSDARSSVESIDRVVCGEGPGSFTSLRIAGAIAKGLCLGREIPLYAVSSLALAAATTSQRGAFVVCIDALRDEWYAAVFDRTGDGDVVQRGPVTLVAKADLEQFASDIGPFVTDAEPDARACGKLLSAVEARGPVDLERWEPAYGRLAEAQVKWEAAHGRALGT